MNQKENFDEIRQENMSDSKPCCSADSGGGDCCALSSDSRWKNFKTVMFVAVVLAAAGVAAHSLLTKNIEATNASIEATSSLDNANSSIQSGDVKQEAAAGPCGVTLDTVRAVEMIAEVKKANVVFLFLAGDNEEAGRSASAQIGATVDMLSAKGKQVAAFTLRNNSQGYNELIEQLGVKSLPSVIVSGKGFGTVAVSGEITEAKLLGAFVKATTSASCGPQSSPLCCPK